MPSPADLAQRFVISLDAVPTSAWLDAVACWEGADETVRGVAMRALVVALSRERLHGSAMFLAHVVEDHVFAHWSRAGYRGVDLIEIGDRTLTVASQAAFALLAREGLARADFDVLYAPFAGVLPLAELERDPP